MIHQYSCDEMFTDDKLLKKKNSVLKCKRKFLIKSNGKQIKSKTIEMKYD